MRPESHARAFFAAAWKHAGDVVTGSLLLFVAIAIAQAFGVPIPWTAYVWIVFGALLIGAFRAYQNERSSRRALENELAQLKAAPKPTVADWKDLADRFDKNAERGQGGAHAQRTHWSHGDEVRWSMNGGEVVAECDELCRLAGAMLTKTPCSLGHYSSLATNPRDRWLEYLRENHSAVGVGDTLFAIETLNGVDKNAISLETIRGVAQRSRTACLYCASRIAETGQ